jgi:hypothetical protein
MKKSHLISTLCSAALALAASLVHAAVLPLEGRLETSLGSGVYQAYYDPNLNITWAQDANINVFDNWDAQSAWAAGLTIGGVSGWHLPSADVNGDDVVIDCSSGGIPGCEDNQMGYLRWEEGITTQLPDPFSNIHLSYWSSTEDASNSSAAWSLSFQGGGQSSVAKINNFAAWAVHNGDVSAVPVPAAFWLFGSGLLGLVGMARRKKAA